MRESILASLVLFLSLPMTMFSGLVFAREQSTLSPLTETEAAEFFEQCKGIVSKDRDGHLFFCVNDTVSLFIFEDQTGIPKGSVRSASKIVEAVNKGKSVEEFQKENNIQWQKVFFMFMMNKHGEFVRKKKSTFHLGGQLVSGIRFFIQGKKSINGVRDSGFIAAKDTGKNQVRIVMLYVEGGLAKDFSLGKRAFAYLVDKGTPPQWVTTPTPRRPEPDTERYSHRENASSAKLEQAAKMTEEGYRLFREGKYDVAISLSREVITICEKSLGPYHPRVARSLNDLANLYKAKGEYARAESLCRRALTIVEKALGPDHPDVAYSLKTLAGLYQAKGEYSKAEKLYKRALAIEEKALGPEHPDVAAMLNNLALLYQTKGDYNRAEPLYKRALDIVEKSPDKDHFTIGACLNNLALLYQAKGDYARAEPICRRALTITEKALGPEHPDVAACLNNLALLYQTKGDYNRAEPLYKRALGIQEKALGPDHPYIQYVLSNIANIYRQKGDYTAAESLLNRALVIVKKTLGPDHPAAGQRLKDIAAVYRDKGDLKSAEQYGVANIY